MTKDIKIKNLKKYFGEKKVLDIPELVLKKGGITYLLGENGVGKSTLANIIAKIDHEYFGNVEVLFSSKEISLVDATPYMLKGSVYKNLEYPLKLRNKKLIKERVEELLEYFNLEKLRDKEASQLSSGETQKVAIMRALSFSPKLLILDEPSANLDKSAKLELIKILKDYNRHGNTIIIITHEDNFFKNLEGKKIILENLEN